MKAVILCNTDTERASALLPVTERMPLCGFEIAGVTPLYYAVQNAYSNGLSDIYVIGDYLSRRIEEYLLTDRFKNMKPKFCQYESNFANKINEIADGEDILLLTADVYQALPLDKLLAFYNENRPSAAVLTAECERGFGTNVRAEGEKLTEIGGLCSCEKAEQVFCGAAILSAEAVEALKNSPANSLAELLSELAEGGDDVLVCLENAGFAPINSTADLLEAAHTLLANGSASDISELPKAGFTLIEPVYIGRNVTLEKGCVLENTVVADNAVIGARARLKGCIVDESANIGAGVQAQNAIICANSHVKPSVTLEENCVIGENSLIGSGARVESGVKIYAERRVEAGEIVSADVKCGHGGEPTLDEEGCCTFPSGATPTDAARFAMAVGTALREGSTAVCSCAEGSRAMLAAFESGLESAGVTVFSIGTATPQQTMFLINRLGADVGMCINNGGTDKIWLMSRGGLSLELKLQTAVERACSLARYRKLPNSYYGTHCNMSDCKQLYKIYLNQMLPKAFAGLNADVRTADVALARLSDDVIRAKNDLSGEHVIFHISGDGRACTAYSDATGYVTGERLILLAVKANFEHGLPVALPNTFPLAADKLAEQLGGKLYRYFEQTGDGDDAARAVAERPDNFFVRDGLVLLCTVCNYLSSHRVTLAQAMADIPQFYSSQRFAASKASAGEICRVLGCRREGGDGVVISDGTTRAMVRPLRHRRGMVIFTESVSCEAASELCDEVICRLKMGLDK